MLPASIQRLLEVVTLEKMQAARQDAADLVKHYWDCYAELARQRNLISEEIKAALIQTCNSYPVLKWQRAVKYKYSYHPLSAVGSLTYIGGRFNTGAGVNPEVPSFPALYIAEDKDTALQEHLGQPVPKDSIFTAREIALTNPSSETIVSVSGKLDMVFDLTESTNLAPFVKLIKNFKHSDAIKISADKLQVKAPGIIKTISQLIETLLKNDWRKMPSNYDVPANSQIFGYLVHLSGIEGILYPSKLTGKKCLAIFPRNFNQTDSYIELDDETPDQKIPSRIDSSNWRISELNAKELSVKS